MAQRGDVRPMPSDFRELAGGMTHTVARKHWRTSTLCVLRWYREAGIEPREPLKGVTRSAPKDFHVWAPVETSAQLCKRYRSSDLTVARWRRETGIAAPKYSHVAAGKPPNGNKPRVIPDGFAKAAQTMTRSQLAKHFGAGETTIKRWAKEAGVKLPTGRPRAASKNGWGHSKVVVIDTRDNSLASRAQSFLQRFYPVWRCNEDGTFNPAGSHYRCDGITRTADEMIERARRKGFDENRWRLAA